MFLGIWIGDLRGREYIFLGGFILTEKIGYNFVSSRLFSVIVRSSSTVSWSCWFSCVLLANQRWLWLAGVSSGCWSPDFLFSMYFSFRILIFASLLFLPHWSSCTWPPCQVSPSRRWSPPCSSRSACG